MSPGLHSTLGNTSWPPAAQCYPCHPTSCQVKVLPLNNEVQHWHETLNTDRHLPGPQTYLALKGPPGDKLLLEGLPVPILRGV